VVIPAFSACISSRSDIQYIFSLGLPMVTKGPLRTILQSIMIISYTHIIQSATSLKTMKSTFFNCLAIFKELQISSRTNTYFSHEVSLSSLFLFLVAGLEG
jgi:hypothetical protein